jgi:hypothetical protein
MRGRSDGELAGGLGDGERFGSSPEIADLDKRLF